MVTRSARYRRGVGLAVGAWGYFIQPRSDVELSVENGHLTVGTASQDLGTGSRSVLADVVGGVFGMRPQEIRVEMGRSTLARGPISSGSRTTASIRPAALEAAEQMQQRLLQLAAKTPGLGPATLDRGGISCNGRFVPWPEVFAAVPPTRIVAGRPKDRLPFVLPFALGDFQIGRGVPVSAHVVEVEVDAALGRVLVPRIWAAISVGDIASVPLATSQAHGGAIQGLGYALYEERVLDPSSGIPLTVSLDDYRIPGIADVPEISVEFLAGGFSYVKGGGVGLGEITTIAVSAAIGNAVAHATGWQPTELPLHPPRVLAGLAAVTS
jgi:xanthine dehydrogenase YagR molybdenum-binding subunit